MFIKLLIIFITIPLLELALLLRVAEAIGGLNTFALIILTGIAGSILTRLEGLRTFYQIQLELQANRLPAVEFIGGFLVFAAGLMLLTPGIMTDIVGFAILIPALRRRLAIFILSRLELRLHSSSSSRQTDWRDPASPGKHGRRPDGMDDEKTIEVEATVLDEEDDDKA